MWQLQQFPKRLLHFSFLPSSSCVRMCSKLNSTILSDWRVGFTLTRGGDWDFSSQFQRSALSCSFLFKTLFHLYPQGVKLSWPTTPVSFFGLACLYQQVTALENLAWLGLEGGLELTRDPAANGQTSQGIKLLVGIKCDSVISRSRYYLKTRVPSPIFVTGTTLRWVLVLLINFIVRYE